MESVFGVVDTKVLVEGAIVLTIVAMVILSILLNFFSGASPAIVFLPLALMFSIKLIDRYGQALEEKTAEKTAILLKQIHDKKISRLLCYEVRFLGLDKKRVAITISDTKKQIIKTEEGTFVVDLNNGRTYQLWNCRAVQ